MSDAILEIRGLRLTIRTDEGMAKVLDNIDFALERGRILGIVGESGCGKSTIIRAIIGILPAVAGAAPRKPGPLSDLERGSTTEFAN